MNRNIIRVGILLTTSSVMPDIALASPTIDLYSDYHITPKVHSFKDMSGLTQISQVEGGKYIFDTSYLVPASINASVSSVSNEELDDLAILKSVVKKIQESKPLPAEFSKVIDEDFWDLI